MPILIGSPHGNRYRGPFAKYIKRSIPNRRLYPLKPIAPALTISEERNKARMPAVASPSKVLVSGANGYIAAWVVRTLLEKGYAVRGTVRSEAKGVHLKKLFAEHGDKFEVVVVEDITKVRRLRPSVLVDTAFWGAC